MMKKITRMFNFMLLILMIFSFTSTQVMALNCGIHCAVQESIDKEAKSMDMANHECCHGKKDKKEEKKSSGCMDEYNGSCFHELASNKIFHKKINEITSKVIFLNELPILNIVKLVGVHNRYLSKIPDAAFLKFKSNLSLYILKDQFLI